MHDGAVMCRFVDATSNNLLDIDRTFITFYDLDDSRSGLSECLQMRETSGVFAVLDDSTELAQVPDNEVTTIRSTAADASEGATLDPSLPLFCSTQTGKGARLLSTDRFTPCGLLGVCVCMRGACCSASVSAAAPHACSPRGALDPVLRRVRQPDQPKLTDGGAGCSLSHVRAGRQVVL